jgi:hypothetical protein
MPNHSEPGIVYTHSFPNTNSQTKQQPQNQETLPYTTTQIHTPHNIHPYRDSNPQFNLSIARPKIDFPTISGDEPVNWLRQCEKYFSLPNVPMEIWVSLATLHYHGMAYTWWRSLRTPANYLHWAQFCNITESLPIAPIHHLNCSTT